MMSVLEYANDVNKPIEEITKLCQKLNIAIEDENTMLDDDAIIMLDNEIANLTSEDNLDNIDEEDGEEMPQSEDDITDSYEEELEEVTLENTKKKHKSNSPKTGDIQIEMLITVMIISAIGIVIILRKKLKK